MFPARVCGLTAAGCRRENCTPCSPSSLRVCPWGRCESWSFVPPAAASTSSYFLANAASEQQTQLVCVCYGTYFSCAASNRFRSEKREFSLSSSVVCSYLQLSAGYVLLFLLAGRMEIAGQMGPVLTVQAYRVPALDSRADEVWCT